MSDELLPYYNRELSFIRRLAGQFAEAHPKIAGRLRLGTDTSEDPHVERLVEAFAYLNARLRHKLEDEFPEITESLLGVLYPHYQAPLPSMAVVQFTLDPEQSELTTGHTVPRHTMLETEPIQGEPCRFRTCYATTIWPIELKAVNLSRPPFQAPSTPHSAEAASVLALTLTCRGKQAPFSALRLDSLRFFLKGQAQHVYRLYELILNNTLEVALANHARDPEVVVLDKDCLVPVGFERDEGMLPYPARSFVGYRLLTEFFAFPEKFLFFDLARLNPQVLKHLGNQAQIYLYLNRSDPDLEQNVSTDTFRLGCTPVVNLYTQRPEPIRLDQTDFEYRVVPDARRPLGHEVYSIDRVLASSPGGEKVEYQPFFSVKHASEDVGARPFWYATRRPAEGGKGRADSGSEVYLSLVDLNFRPSQPADWTVTLETTCLNRDLPRRLPFGGNQPRLQFSEGGALVSQITCLTPPTRTLRPALRQGALWRLISHLSLNHLSLTDAGDKAEALREILKLYDFSDSAETRKTIDGILDIRGRRVVGLTHGPMAAVYCRGVEVTVRFDEDKYTGLGLFLFATVLERFLALYCSINSFTKMIATTKGREGELRRWPPRIGEKVLV